MVIIIKTKYVFYPKTPTPFQNSSLKVSNHCWPNMFAHEPVFRMSHNDIMVDFNLVIMVASESSKMTIEFVQVKSPSE
jgi:hypothetical protein